MHVHVNELLARTMRAQLHKHSEVLEAEHRAQVQATSVEAGEENREAEPASAPAGPSGLRVSVSPTVSRSESGSGSPRRHATSPGGMNTLLRAQRWEQTHPKEAAESSRAGSSPRRSDSRPKSPAPTSPDQLASFKRAKEKQEKREAKEQHQAELARIQKEVEARLARKSARIWSRSSAAMAAAKSMSVFTLLHQEKLGRNREGFEVEHEEKHTHRPKLDKKSLAMAKQLRNNEHPDVPRLEYLHRQGVTKIEAVTRKVGKKEFKDERLPAQLYHIGPEGIPGSCKDDYIETIRKEREEAEPDDEECSFKPALNMRSRYLLQRAPGGAEPFQRRQQQWMEKQHEKRQELEQTVKVTREQEFEESCTFKPKVQPTVSKRVSEQAERMRALKELRKQLTETGAMPGSPPRFHPSWQESIRSSSRPRSAPHSRSATPSSSVMFPSGAYSTDDFEAAKKLHSSLSSDISYYSGGPAPESGSSGGGGDAGGSLLTKWERKHYDRLQRGRARQAEIRRVLNLYDGTRWQGQPTRPVAPSFNRRPGASAIKSLRAPVAALDAASPFLASAVSHSTSAAFASPEFHGVRVSVDSFFRSG